MSSHDEMVCDRLMQLLEKHIDRRVENECVAEEIVPQINSYLDEMSIHFEMISQSIYKTLAQAQNKTLELNFSNCAIDDTFLRELRSLYPSLKGLYLRNCGIEHTTVEILTSFSELEVLDLSVAQSDLSESIHMLCQLKKLKKLNLSSHEYLEDEDLLLLIGALPHLETLIVQHCPRLTCKLFERLKASQYLKNIDVQGSMESDIFLPESMLDVICSFN